MAINAKLNKYQMTNLISATLSTLKYIGINLILSDASELLHSGPFILHTVINWTQLIFLDRPSETHTHWRHTSCQASLFMISRNLAALLVPAVAGWAARRSQVSDAASLRGTSAATVYFGSLGTRGSEEKNWSTGRLSRKYLYKYMYEWCCSLPPSPLPPTPVYLCLPLFSH